MTYNYILDNLVNQLKDNVDIWCSGLCDNSSKCDEENKKNCGYRAGMLFQYHKMFEIQKMRRF